MVAPTANACAHVRRKPVRRERITSTLIMRVLRPISDRVAVVVAEFAGSAWALCICLGWWALAFEVALFECFMPILCAGRWGLSDGVSS